MNTIDWIVVGISVVLAIFIYGNIALAGVKGEYGSRGHAPDDRPESEKK